MFENPIKCGWKPSREAWLKTERRAANLGYTSWKPACIHIDAIHASMPSKRIKIFSVMKELHRTPRGVPPLLVEPLTSTLFGLLDGPYRLGAAKLDRMKYVPVLMVTSRKGPPGPRKPRNNPVDRPQRVSMPDTCDMCGKVREPAGGRTPWSDVVDDLCAACEEKFLALCEAEHPEYFENSVDLYRWW